ncbi:ferrous iron transport protein A [Roseateles sp. BYS180W]|uniref:Ferrous iron transport protein A n=1 Tax=Roseateles rivi TaxID=3299028 RepID=A0ABW7FU64_9BURK
MTQHAHPAPRGAFMALSDLGLGTPATVVQLVAHASEPSVVARLEELGFLPGESVEVVQRGPGGREPLAVRVGDTMFALRLLEARCVQVGMGTEVCAR